MKVLLFLVADEMDPDKLIKLLDYEEYYEATRKNSLCFKLSSAGSRIVKQRNEIGQYK